MAINKTMKIIHVIAHLWNFIKMEDHAFLAIFIAWHVLGQTPMNATRAKKGII